MANVYGTEGRLLEQLALNEELSVSQLARATGLSYPTTLYKVSLFPFVGFEKAGREKKVKVKDEKADAVYPFLIELQTSKTKRAQLTMAFLFRKGLSDVVLGGELALEKQLPVKDAEPDPEIEIRTRNQRVFKNFIDRMLSKALGSELTSNSKIVEDRNTFFTKKIGLLPVSPPEKLLVDAVAEEQSEVFIENVAETIANAHYSIDMALLRAYAKDRGVVDKVMRELDEAKRSGFP